MCDQKVLRLILEFFTFHKFYMSNEDLCTTKYVFNQPHHHEWHKVDFFFWCTAGLNSKFTFFKTCCCTQVKEVSLPYYLAIIGGRTEMFMPFPREFVQSKTQTISSWICTGVAASLSFNNNHYTMCTVKVTNLGSMSFWFSDYSGIGYALAGHVDLPWFCSGVSCHSVKATWHECQGGLALMPHGCNQYFFNYQGAVSTSFNPLWRG